MEGRNLEHKATVAYSTEMDLEVVDGRRDHARNDKVKWRRLVRQWWKFLTFGVGIIFLILPHPVYKM